MQSRSIPTLNVLVALSCEAKAFVDYYRLSKDQSSAFPYFYRSANERHWFDVNLVVSGVGAANMAAACGWLGALTASKHCAWLNCGIAGHQELVVGEVVRIVCCRDLNSERSHYPPLVVKWSGKAVSLISYSEPCIDYPGEQAVDMEASAFFKTASRFANTELVQSLKIISDNREYAIAHLDSAQISRLIANRVPEINTFATAMAMLVPIPVEARDTAFDIKHLHCTVSQMQQYLDLLNKLGNIGVGVDIVSDKSKTASSMKALLSELRTLQEQTAPNLEVPRVKATR